MVRNAKIHIYYAFSPSLLPQLSHLKLMMNGTLFATVQPTPGQLGGSDSKDAEAEFIIPARICWCTTTRSPSSSSGTTPWSARIRPTPRCGRAFIAPLILDIAGDLLPLADDLKQLPMPFLDPAVIQPLSIPVVFASAPSYKAIQAAGIVTSYFGMISENRPVRFPVHIRAHSAGQRDRHL